MKKTWIVLLFLVALGAGGSWVSAAITERVIHAGDTPLASDCRVTQTGPMELTVMPCFWTTTGEARIVDVTKAIGNFADNTLPTFKERFTSGIQELEHRVAAGEIEYMPDGKRIRGWLKNKDGSIIRKKATYRVAPKTVLTIVAGQKYVVYMLRGPGQTMNVALMNPADTRPSTFIDYLVFKFDVPVGTTDLNTITLEVFTVRPNFPPRKGLFEK